MPSEAPQPESDKDSFEKHWRWRFTSFGEVHENDAGIAGWSEASLQARLRLFRELWETDGKGGLWLDVGCGAGSYTRILAQNSSQVIGVDYSLPSLQKAIQRSASSIRWVAADASRLPFPVNWADGLLCFGVFQALARPEPALGEFSRTIKRNGEVWVDALNAWCLPHLWERVRCRFRNEPTRLRYDSPRHLRRKMKDFGIKTMKFSWLPIFPRRWHMFQPWVETAGARWVFRWIPGVGLLLSHAFVLKGVVQ